MAAKNENHIYREWLKSGIRSQIRLNINVIQILIKTDKWSDHIVIKHINTQKPNPKIR